MCPPVSHFLFHSKTSGLFGSIRSGNRQLPGSLSVQIVLEANSMTTTTGNEEAVMSHVEVEGVEM